MSKNAKKYACEICDYYTSNKTNYTNHTLTSKHKDRTLVYEKNAEKLVCEICDLACSKKSNFDLHLTTTKHKNRTTLNKKQEKNAEKKFTCKNCYKEYKVRNSLWYHEQICFENGIFLENNGKKNVNDNESNYSNNIVVKNNENDIHQLTSLVIEVVKNNSEFQKQMFDMCKNMQSNIITNCNNTNNNTFNLQVFLNEYCKDAMNITEFVDSFNLEVSDLENVGRVGYIEGMSNIIINKIKELDVNKRPIHCSDLKREIIYIKDEDKWEREDEHNTKFRKVIKRVSGKNIGMLNAWREMHPDCLDSDSIYNDVYMKLIIAAMGANDIEGNENKIIKKVAKHVVIDKKTVL